MQQISPSSPRLELKTTENKYADCLSMSIKGVLVQPDQVQPKFPNPFAIILRKKKPTSIELVKQIDLYLTIQFNEQTKVPIPGGEIAFGIKGGELRLKLENGKIPLESRELAGSLEHSVQKERQLKEGTEAQSGIKTTVVDMKPGLEANRGEKKIEEKTDKFQLTVYQVTAKGSETYPAWVFKVETGEPILRGLLKEATLGRIEVEGNPCGMEATFEVSKQYVQITDASGVWLKNFSFKQLDLEKQRVLDIWILKKFLMPKLQPHLSKVVLSYDV